MFRLANPRTILRVAAGREKHLWSAPTLSLYVADSIFVGDYSRPKATACCRLRNDPAMGSRSLKTGGQPLAVCRRRIFESGFRLQQSRYFRGLDTVGNNRVEWSAWCVL